MRKMMAGFVVILTLMFVAATVKEASAAEPTQVLQVSVSHPAQVPTHSLPKGLSAPNFPAGWVIRLHQWSFFSGPPATYDISIIQFMDWNTPGTATRCIEIGGNWDNVAMAISMNAPGEVALYAGHGCYGGLVANPRCIDGSFCQQQKTCDYSNWGPATGWWVNDGGSPICASHQVGQPSSMRWGRWKAT